MTWNNRIFRHSKELRGKVHSWYAIHEAYYDDRGKVTRRTELPIDPFGETPEELIEHLKQLLADAERCQHDILEFKNETQDAR